MAERNIFVPNGKKVGVFVFPIKFKWFPGMSVSQKQKSVLSLHEEARRQTKIENIMEISSKSLNPIGIELSAFNLSFQTNADRKITVESAFQGSKVFEYGGPFKDLYEKRSIDAKKDPRLKSSGLLKKFLFFKEEFPITPRTFFYDWIYINALNKRTDLHTEILRQNAFSDIEFNAEKSINCQAYSVALFVSLYKNDLLKQALSDKNVFLDILKETYKFRDQQLEDNFNILL